MTSPKTRVATIAAPNPAPSATRPRVIAPVSRTLSPSATPMIALYSGPTTIAPTIRICELIRIPTAPISPAIVSRTKNAGG
jgi:hypothetical protein